MTRLLEQAIAKLKTLPEQDQDAIALAILGEIDSIEVPLDDATRAAIRDGVEQARRGEFASDEEMEALWKRFDA